MATFYLGMATFFLGMATLFLGLATFFSGIIFFQNGYILVPHLRVGTLKPIERLYQVKNSFFLAQFYF